MDERSEALDSGRNIIMQFQVKRLPLFEQSQDGAGQEKNRMQLSKNLSLMKFTQPASRRLTGHISSHVWSITY